MQANRRQGGWWSGCGAAALALLLAAPARADETRGDAPRDRTEYAFDDELVAGVDRGPSGEVLHTRRTKRGESLVRARSSFVDRLLKSVEQL